MHIIRKIVLLGTGLCGLSALTGCHLDMWRQNKTYPLSQSEFFQDQQASRPLPAGTVQHAADGSKLRVGNAFYTGLDSNKKLVRTVPAVAYEKFPGNNDSERRLAMLKRGQERFNIFCSPCHGRLGDGNGMIAMRGLSLRRHPATYHSERLRKLPDGHIYDVITNGFGVMYSYASRIQDPEDRWAIVAYIRALQFSQNAKPSDIPAGIDLDKPVEEKKEAAESETAEK